MLQFVTSFFQAHEICAINIFYDHKGHNMDILNIFLCIKISETRHLFHAVSVALWRRHGLKWEAGAAPC